ncbi:Hypothetical protein, putative [Bodo saltans]|uniref:phospholipase D n=1 Tax=Bodo saltans TaxID=75058 RepID=A0A0S4JDH3_BODSA|nr:Hypothetical protein, putative [Bodo saltans]|eukprot:CUG89435.1 Hypothetical protein, putative [Bodo saltans]
MLRTIQAARLSLASKFEQVLPNKQFPNSVKEFCSITSIFHQRWYDEKPANEMQGMLRVLGQDDVYKSNKWFRKRTPPGHKKPSDRVHTRRILTDKKKKHHGFLWKVLLYCDRSGDTLRSFREALGLPEETDIPTLVKAIMKEKSLEAKREYRYQLKQPPTRRVREVQLELHAATMTNGTASTPQENETSKQVHDYDLFVPDSLLDETSSFPHLLTDVTLHPKLPESKGQKTDQHSGEQQQGPREERWMRFPAAKANVETFVNTKEYFADLNGRLCNLLQSPNNNRVLYMMGWMFSADMRLVPSDEQSTLRHHITALHNAGVEIRILYWQWGSYAIDQLLDPAGTDAALLTNALHVIGLTRGVHYIDHRVHDRGSLLSSRIYTHHQKHVTIIDGNNMTSFCGGSDIAVGRYDDNQRVVFRNELHHDTDRFDSSLRYGGTGGPFGPAEFVQGAPRLMWQDVQVRIDGPSALNVARTFEYFFKRALSQQRLSTASTPRYSENAVIAPCTSSNAVVQIINAKNRSFAFEQAMIHQINTATKEIYIEQQYFQGKHDFSNNFVPLKNSVPIALISRILERNDPHFRVRIVLPLVPDCYLRYDKFLVKEILNMHYETKRFMRDTIRQACEGDQVKYPHDLTQCLEFYYLARDIDGRIYPIYVHTKLMIVDDAVCVIGSANVNDRSQMAYKDTEIAAIISSAEVAKNLRDRVREQHRVFLRPFPVDPNVVIGYYGPNNGNFNIQGRHYAVNALFPHLVA